MLNVDWKMIWSRSRSTVSSWNSSANTAPVRWASSVRPLTVRTIWVDGVRHAILSLDDPLIRYQSRPFCHRPGSSSTSTTSSLSSDSSSSSSATSNELEECLVKLRVALDSAEEIHLPPIDDSSVSSPRSEVSPSPSSAPLNFPQNPLSERVLQWLDLANKGHPLPQPLLPKRPRNVSSGFKSLQTKRKLYSRSATVDIPNNSGIQRKQSIPMSTTSVPTTHTKEYLSEFQSALLQGKEEQTKQVETESAPPIVPQRYEPLRPLTAWPSSKSSRPQLHIFMPSLTQTIKTPPEHPDDFCTSYTS